MNETQTAAQLLAKRFPFKPTPGQSQFFEQIGTFITHEDFEHYRDCFLLRGYAGTGKDYPRWHTDQGITPVWV